MASASIEQTRERLRRARREDRVAGAYLFTGRLGSGKRETALWFARLLLCKSDGDDPCGICGGCTRTHAADGGDPQHADLKLVEPDGASVKIEQIRTLQTELALVANEGGWRVALILDAEKLGLGSANALLKLLEEPPSRTTLILVVTVAETLPPTLRSRTALLRFVPEDDATTVKALLADGLDERDAELAAALGGGSVESARAWAAEHLDDAREIRDAIYAAETSSATQVLDFAESFRGGAAARERAVRFLAVYAALARSEVARAATDGNATGLERWLDRADAGERARRELARRNLNPQMLVESLLFS